MTSPGGPWEASVYFRDVTGGKQGAQSESRQVKYSQEVQENLVHPFLPLHQLLPKHNDKKQEASMDQIKGLGLFLWIIKLILWKDHSRKHTHTRTFSSFDTLRTLQVTVKVYKCLTSDHKLLWYLM